MIVVKGQAHMYGWFREQNLPDNWHFAVSKNGWTDRHIGLKWLQGCFEPYTRPQDANQKRLLLLDGHNSHLSIEFAEFAEQNNMILFCFPPHTTHLLQPLDVSIFGPLKKRYSDEILSLASSSLSVTKPQFLQVYAKIRNETITTRAGKAAFKSVGICDIVTAAPVLARLPQRDITPENHITVSAPQTPKNSRQVVAMASQTRSAERLTRESRHL